MLDRNALRHSPCRLRARGLFVFWGTLVALCSGCPAPTDGTGTPFLDSQANSTFDSATALPLTNTSQLTFKGTISGPNDLDLYDLGTLEAGDEVYVDVQRKSGDLDAVAALFNANQDLQDYNDDRTSDSSDVNPLIDFVTRVADHYFLGVAAYAGSGSTGDYEVTLKITRNVPIPAPQSQIVYLNWAGGDNIVVPNVGTYNLPAFDAADLGPYQGRTTEMKRRVEQIVRQRYTGYNLDLRSSDAGPEPAASHSTVYFGGFDRDAFAISEQVDSFNKDPGDKAIVFTQSFRNSFATVPSFDQMAQALGNTVAHEVGHLLGLVHTADAADLMDTSSGNDRILQSQQFGTAPIDPSVFPTGLQDSPELLTWIIGLLPV